MANVSIRELNADNWIKAARLQVGEAQSNFVATNMESIAWSRFESDLIPAGIYADDDVVGFVLYGKWPDEPNRWGIARYMIDANQQGKGYGKAGMQEVIRMIREEHPEATGLKLAYVPGNDVARGLYASVGFRETGEMWGDEIIAALDFEIEATKESTGSQSKIAQAKSKEVTIKPLDQDTWQIAANLSVLESQKGFVSSNIRSIALSSFLPLWIPAGIYADDEMVGFVFYGPIDEENGQEGEWHIMRYMIDKDQQGKGYGKAALKVVIDDILTKAPDIHVIDLSVAPENARAIHVYETLGFRMTGIVDHGEAVMALDVHNVWKSRS
jgi:diamine N-acetyltransferase